QQAALAALAEERDAARAEADRARRQIDQFTHNTLSSNIPPTGRFGVSGVPQMGPAHTPGNTSSGTLPGTPVAGQGSAQQGGQAQNAQQSGAVSNGGVANGAQVNGAGEPNDPLYTGQ